MKFGYFSSHFSLALSKFSNACDSVVARYMLFKSEVNPFLSLYDILKHFLLGGCNGIDILFVEKNYIIHFY
ncbi:hypothetical protein [Fusobacterium hwasookii]|uniref:hypothetical protein n=1 Tax=Fusobacterium hwasookii TaxID=1583098 RepID=UPI0028EDD2B7|nr:hypothetical protein [Fusobacterium hwasookii]